MIVSFLSQRGWLCCAEGSRRWTSRPCHPPNISKSLPVISCNILPLLECLPHSIINHTNYLKYFQMFFHGNVFTFRDLQSIERLMVIISLAAFSMLVSSHQSIVCLSHHSCSAIPINFPAVPYLVTSDSQ